MKLGYLPPMTKGFTTDPNYVIPLVEMLEEVGIESVWAVEHVIMAENYEPLYPYSADGMAPTAPDTLMPDPLEWLAFVAARTQTIRLANPAPYSDPPALVRSSLWRCRSACRALVDPCLPSAPRAYP